MGKSLFSISIAILAAALLSKAGNASTLGPAQFNARCSLTSEIIGHPVPPYTGVEQGILNDYPIATTYGGKVIQIADIYPTVGGISYAVPTANAYRLGLTLLSDSASWPVGANSWLRNSVLDKRVVVRMQPLLKTGVVPRFLIPPTSRGGSACFIKDWNAKVPS